MFGFIGKNIPTAIVGIIATITTGTAVTKAYVELEPLFQSRNHAVVEARFVPTPSTGAQQVTTDGTTPPDSSGAPMGSDSGASQITPTVALPVPTQQQINQGTAVFDAASLKLHNTGSSCFIAYSGTVYDVTNHPSWSGCTHHGQTGGKDITSIFPHSTSYFATLPKVGTFVGSNQTPSPTKGGDDDDDDKTETHNSEGSDSHSGRDGDDD